MEIYLKKQNIINLKNLADEMSIKYSKDITKENLILDIVKYFEKYNKKSSIKKRNPVKSPVKTTKSPTNSPVKIKTYKKFDQLGNIGKEGITYLVKDENENEYAMKTFKKTKSSTRIENEAELQKKASFYEISPKIIDVNLEEKYIVMEKLDKHLFDVMKKQNGNLTKLQQQQIIKIYKNLDKSGVFHGDSNILNYMFKDKKLYMIDFGMSKFIDDNLIKKVGTKNPNLDLMTLGFILKLKELKCPESSYSYLITHVSDLNKAKYQL